MTVLVALAVIAYAGWVGAGIHWGLAALAVAGSVLLHAMTNLLNDYYDTARGVDRPGVGTVEYRPHPLVHGFMTPGQVAGLAYASGLAAVALAGAAALAGRPLAVPLALAGFALAYAYNGPPFNFKYVGLGELAVYLAWGIVIPVGVYYMATGSLSLAPAAYAAPIALLIVNVLLANNIRDAESDRRAGVMTLAARIGAGAAARLYTALTLAAYAIPALLAAARLAPPGTLAVLVTLPAALRLARILARSPPPDADPRAAGIALAYAAIYTAATAAHALLA